MGGGPRRPTEVLVLFFGCVRTPAVRRTGVNLFCSWIRSSTNLATPIASNSVLGLLPSERKVVAPYVGDGHF